MALHRQWQLADAFGEAGSVCNELRGIAGLGDDFDQGHLRHRIEKVQADETLRLLQVFRQFFQGYAGCVAGQQCRGLHDRFDLSVEVLFGLDILIDGFDDHVSLLDACAQVIRYQAVHGILNLVAIAEFFPKQLVSAADRTAKMFRCPVLQRHNQAFQNAPGGNIPTHDTAADDMHMPGCEITFFRQPLETVLQQEHTNQVLCGFPCQQCRYLSRFTGVHPGCVPGMFPPVIDQRIGGRIVFRPGVSGHLPAKQAGDERPQQRIAGETPGQRGGMCRWLLQDQPAGGIFQLPFRNGKFNQMKAFCRAGTDRPGRQHHLYGWQVPQ